MALVSKERKWRERETERERERGEGGGGPRGGGVEGRKGESEWIKESKKGCCLFIVGIERGRLKEGTWKARWRGERIRRLVKGGSSLSLRREGGD